MLDDHPEQFTRLQEKFKKVSKMGRVEMEDLYDKLSEELK
jgi:hypothetical protein